jgi:hypothetical protein
LPILSAAAKNLGVRASVNPTLPALSADLGYVLQMPDGSEKYLEIDSHFVGTYLTDEKVSFQNKVDSLTEKMGHALLTDEHTFMIG